MSDMGGAVCAGQDRAAPRKGVRRPPVRLVDCKPAGRRATSPAAGCTPQPAACCRAPGCTGAACPVCVGSRGSHGAHHARGASGRGPQVGVGPPRWASGGRPRWRQGDRRCDRCSRRSRTSEIAPEDMGGQHGVCCVASGIHHQAVRCPACHQSMRALNIPGSWCGVTSVTTVSP